MDLFDIKIFDDNKCKFKKTSEDDTNNACMTNSETIVVNFDKVKFGYIRELALSKIPMSVDALYQEGNKVYFVEFKNGHIDKKDIFDIKKKIYDSILIFSDITKETLCFLRDNAEFILVYNENVNQEKSSSDQSGIDISSKEFDTIGKTISKYAGKEFIKFNIYEFERYCFNQVHTFTIKEFETFIKELS